MNIPILTKLFSDISPEVPKPTYWHVEGRIGKNTAIGRVKAVDKAEAIDRGLKAAHSKYPGSLVVMLGGKCRPIL